MRVIVVRGSGGNFSSGHDLGTPEALAYRGAARRGARHRNLRPVQEIQSRPAGALAQFRRSRPSRWSRAIASMPAGCWRPAATSSSRRATRSSSPASSNTCRSRGISASSARRRLCFESRFISARGGARIRLRQSRAVAPPILNARPMAYRAARGGELAVRAALRQNPDEQGAGCARLSASALEDSFGDYVAMIDMRGRRDARRRRARLATVDLAVKGRKGERFGSRRRRDALCRPPRFLLGVRDRGNARRGFMTDHDLRRARGRTPPSSTRQVPPSLGAHFFRTATGHTFSS